MKTLQKLILCGIFSACFTSAFSQQGLFSIQTLSFPDTSFLGITDSTVDVTIKYAGASSYSGSVSIWIGTQQTNFNPVLFCIIQQTTLQPNDSVQANCSIIFDSTNFAGGNNIVVVWSSGNAILPADSVWDNVYLKTLSSVNEIPNSFLFSLHPSVTPDFLQIELLAPQRGIEKVRIIDLFGREIIGSRTIREKKNTIDVSGLPTGIYFLEVSSGLFRGTKKFAKTD